MRYIAAHVLGTAATIPEEIGPNRTRKLIEYARREPFFSGAMYAHTSRLANARYRVSGGDTETAINFLRNLEFSRGWKHFLMALFSAVLVSDTGAWFEKVRTTYARVNGKRLPVYRTYSVEDRRPVWSTGDGSIVDPADVVVDLSSPVQTLCVIDPVRIAPGETPNYPILFLDYDDTWRPLHSALVSGIIDSPVPGQMYGRCAASRVLEAVRLMLSIFGWHQERVEGRLPGTLIITNVFPKAITKALEDATNAAVAAGNQRFVPTAFVSPLDPSARPVAEVIHLADLPEGFNLQDFIQMYLIIISNGLGVDYASLAPLPGSRLGTATEAEVMARLAATRSYGLLLGMLEHTLGDVMSQFGSRFEFVAADYTEEWEAARAALMRAQCRSVRIKSGEITPEVARQLASDAGDLSIRYLEKFFGEADLVTEPVR